MFSAVWTGTVMIVWGGSSKIPDDKTTLTNSGGRYNPSTDSWAATSTTGAPSARDNQTAVWTGTSMIIWGGEDGAGSGSIVGGMYFTGIPYEVPATSLSWTGKNSLSWSAADCATSYRVYKGNPSELKNLPTGASVCMAYNGNGSSATTTDTTLTSNPAAGSFFWYLAVGYNANGEGSAGQSSYGQRMINSTGQSCP
jgi:hypothetical protein